LLVSDSAVPLIVLGDLNVPGWLCGAMVSGLRGLQHELDGVGREFPAASNHSLRNSRQMVRPATSASVAGREISLFRWISNPLIPDGREIIEIAARLPERPARTAFELSALGLE
jgi:hypothetical protein